MAKVYLNPLGKFNIRNDGSGAGGAQVLDARCSQKRVYIAASGAFDNNTPAFTVGHMTDYIQLVTDGTVLVWSGPSDTSAQDKQDFACAVGAGTYTCEVSIGDVVHVWTAA